MMNRPPGDKMDEIDKHIIMRDMIYVFSKERLLS